MPEKKNIQTFTFAFSSLDELEICSIYSGTDVVCSEESFHTLLPNVKLSEIKDVNGSLNSVNFLNGEMIIAGENLPLQNDIAINIEGELLVYGSDSDKYEIDENGYLVYDFCQEECSTSYYVCGYIEDDYIL